MDTELKCKWCERYIGKSHGNIQATLKCPNSSCKGETQFNQISTDISKSINFTFKDKPQEPKKKGVENE